MEGDLKFFSELAAGLISTPFYLIDLDQIKSSFVQFECAWKSKFNRFKIAYSYKSNALKAITQQFCLMGSCAEVVSQAELEWALEDGFKASQIFFDGPLKKLEELEFALQQGVNIQLDSLEELNQLLFLFNKTQKSTQISIRLAANYRSSKKSRFGFNLEDAFQAIRRLEQVGHCLSGLHIHLGSNLTEPHLFYHTLSEYADVFKLLLSNKEKRIWLDIGGGFPAKSVNKQMVPIPLEDFAQQVLQFFTENVIDFEQVELITEPGRCLVEDHGYLITSVCNKKKREDHQLLIVDGGIHLIRSLSSWHHPIKVFKQNSSLKLNHPQPYQIFGSNCFESDIFVNQFEIDEDLGIGDLVAVGSAGGYDICSANAWTRPLPAILGILDGKLCMLRASQTNQDVRKWQNDFKELKHQRMACSPSVTPLLEVI
jgi:diaminopimelate decarboxylase